MKQWTIAKSKYLLLTFLAMLFFLVIPACDIEQIKNSRSVTLTYELTRTPTLQPPISIDLVILPQTTTLTPMDSFDITDTLPQDDLQNDDDKLSQPKNTPTPESFLVCSPLASEEIDQLWEIISDPYNPPPPGRDERHQGVDFAYYRRNQRMGIEGEEIQSIFPGVVVAKVVNRLPYGNMVMIETPNQSLPELLRTELKISDDESLYHLYAHMKQEPYVDLQDEVGCGQRIGIVGSTGYNIVNAHLHLETRTGPENTFFNTMVFYDTAATLLEMDTYKLWRTSGEFNHFDPMIIFRLYLDRFLDK